MKGRVLFLGSNDRSALAAARSLGRSKVSVDVARIGPSTICERSRYVAHSIDLGDARSEMRRSIDLLVQHLSNEEYDVLIPMGDAAAELASYARNAIGSRTRLAMPSREAYELCHDKEQTLRLGKKLGVPVPSYQTLRRWEDLERLRITRSRFPCYLKPIHSAKVVGDTIAEFRVRKARTETQLLDFCRFNLGNVPVMLQEECLGVGAGVYVLAKQGRILSMVQQVRLHEPHDGGGSSYRMTTAMDPRLEEYSRVIIKESRWTGVAMIEFKGQPESGDWTLMEINGRLWGSLALTIRAGLDFPWWLYQLCTDPDFGLDPIPVKPILNVRQRHLKKDVGWLATTLPRKRNRMALLRSWMQSFRHLLNGNEGLDCEALDDPFPAVWDWLAPAAAQWRRLAGLAERARCAVLYKLSEASTIERVYARLGQGRSKVLFVCKGNICRSAFAEHYMTQKHGVASVRSAGTLMRSNRRSPTAIEYTAERQFDVDMRKHRSQRLDQRLVDWADVIFVMDYRNLVDIGFSSRKRAPALLLGSFGRTGQVSDPYGRSMDDTSIVLEQIKQSVDLVNQAMANGDGMTSDVIAKSA